MAGNSSRRGAVRGPGSKKGATTGSGGQRRAGLEPKGPTPRAEQRPGHPAARKRAASAKGRPARSRSAAAQDIIAGRNAVREALEASVPASELLVLDGIEPDDRTRAALAMANKAGLAIRIATRTDLDRKTGTTSHQGIALVASPFQYLDAAGLPPAGLLVMLDHITDPHNLGAIARSAAAFGAAALVVPDRRSASVTAAAWKASAGALSRLPVARVGNLTTTLRDLKKQGYFVIGLDGAADSALPEVVDGLSGPLVLVVGSEGAGLSRLVAQTADQLVRIDMSRGTESLNASVATGIALYELSRRR